MRAVAPELVDVGALEQGVPGMRREGAEDLRPHHRHHHRPVATGGLSGDPAVVAVGGGGVALVDERHNFVAQVVLVAARAGGVQVLGAAVGRPAIHEDDDRVGALPGCEHRVDALEHVPLEGLAAPPGIELPEVALDDVDGGKRTGVVELHSRGPVHEQRPPGRVAQRVVGEQLRVDREPVDDAGERPFPRGPDRAFGFAQRHQAPAPSRGFPPECAE